MRKSSFVLSAFLASFAVLVVTARSAKTQVGGSLPSFVRLQASSPGTAQSGHANLTGTVMAGAFSGSGSGLTGVPWASITGAPTSFPPNGAAGGDLSGTYPNPGIRAGSVDSLALASDAGSLAKVSGANMSSSGSFVGIGTTTTIGAARFVVNQPTSSFGGMYVNTSATGLPFYGYALGGAISAYSYVDGSDSGKWKLRVGSSDAITIKPSGAVGIGTSNPGYRFEVLSGTLSAAKIVGGAESSNEFISLSPALVVSTDRGDGIYASTDNSGAWAVAGYTGAGGDRGVYGRSDSSTGTGVYGRNLSGGRAGYFDGNVAIGGSLSKGGGSFKIDHPLDPSNKFLYHSFVESPDMKNIYDGIVTTDSRGYAVVTLPDWFEALNREFRYQLTVLDEGEGEWVMSRVVREMHQGRFTIQTSAPRAKVSWQVTGIRHDAWANANRIPVEETKSADERGLYLYPQVIGQPNSAGIEQAREARLRATSGRPN